MSSNINYKKTDFLRSPLRKDWKENDLIINIFDWKIVDCNIINKDEDTTNELSDKDIDVVKCTKFTKIRAYGLSDKNNSVTISINNYKPFYYISIPQNWTKKNIIKFEKILKEKVINSLKDWQKIKIENNEDNGSYANNAIDSLTIVKRKEFYGFTNNKYNKYLKLVFNSINGFYAYKRVLNEGIKLPKSMIDVENKIYYADIFESNIPPILRYFHTQNIDPSGWVKICKNKIGIYEKKTNSQIEIECNANDLELYENNDISPLLIASFDIECTSIDGTFPNPERRGDKIIQIGTTIHRYGENKCCFKHISTLGNCEDIDGISIDCYNNEKSLILGWAKLIGKYINPDIITGYNIWGFDMLYIYKRGITGNGGSTMKYEKKIMRELERYKSKSDYDSGCKFIEKELSSSAMGDNYLKYFEIEGRVSIDLLKLIQKNYNLDNYKLDNVSEHFMGENKIDLSPKQLFDNFNNGSSKKIKEIAEYCIKDCELCNRLIIKLEVIANNIGMSNVTCVPLSFLFTRGQGIKIFSLVAKKCLEEDFLIKEVNKDEQPNEGYEGAIVFKPKPGIYFDPIAVMDYASLYPISMISENISHDSLLSIKEYNLDNNLINIKGNIEYDNLPDYNYNDIDYDIIVEDKDKKKKKIGTKICRYAEKKDKTKSILPRIAEHLVLARKKTRKKAKFKIITLKNKEEYTGIIEKNKKDNKFMIINENNKYGPFDLNDIENEKDKFNDFQKGILEGLQLAYKITCNSLYGQVGSITSPICWVELAASVTAIGRRMVMIAKKETEKKYPSSITIYGDTDSIFVNFTPYIKKIHGKNINNKEIMKYTLKYGIEAGKYITSLLKKPQELEYEKIFYPFCIFTKKRYFGNKYEYDLDKYVQTSMGIALKRRDYVKYVKDIYKNIINIILNEKNIDKAKDFYINSVKDMLEGKLDIKDLIITKTLKGNYSNPTQIAHKILADNMGDRDIGTKPKSNDRVQYCYIDPTKIKCKICSNYISPNNCKCVKCLRIYCNDHLHNHRKICDKRCRFCRTYDNIKRCNTCLGYYCENDFNKHLYRVGKNNNSVIICKKQIKNSLLQGDMIEDPKYIIENNIKLDYKYYLDHQIRKPVEQIFELTMSDTSLLLKDTLIDYNNNIKGQTKITKFFKIF